MSEKKSLRIYETQAVIKAIKQYIILNYPGNVSINWQMKINLFGIAGGSRKDPTGVKNIPEKARKWKYLNNTAEYWPYTEQDATD